MDILTLAIQYAFYHLGVYSQGMIRGCSLHDRTIAIEAAERLRQNDEGDYRDRG
jgi:hypothetical protein